MSVLQALFAADMRGDLSVDSVLSALEGHTTALERDDEDRAFSDVLVKGICAKRAEIDAIILKAAPQWPLEKIAAIDRNVLRIGLFELLFGAPQSVPPKVALNEAIELAKIFGGDSSSRFVNGVLGSVYRELGSPRKEEAPKSKEKEYFAGLVVCAPVKGEVFVALMRDHFDTWTLPKVRYEEGELSDHAALRAAEETFGLKEIHLRAPLKEHDYEAHEPSQGVVKRRVAYFVATAKKLPLSPKNVSGHETGWFSEHELASLTLYEDLRGLIDSGIVAARNHPV